MECLRCGTVRRDVVQSWGRARLLARGYTYDPAYHVDERPTGDDWRRRWVDLIEATLPDEPDQVLEPRKLRSA
jgi:hypothetical protein